MGVAATRTRRAMLAHWCVKGYGVAEILLFDLYGTLVDPLAIAADLTEVLGADGSEVSRQWRAKQLEFPGSEIGQSAARLPPCQSSSAPA